MTLLRAIMILLALATLAILLALAARYPVPVNLHWGSTVLETTAPVAATLLLLAATVLFYLGQLALWMESLPTRLRAWFRGHHEATRHETLLQAYAALYLGDGKEAARQSGKLKTEARPDPFTVLLRLHTNQLTETDAASAITSPVLGPLVALYLARQHAERGNWARVKEFTGQGLQQAPGNAPLTTLHFKALVNLNDPDTTTFLPQLKPLLTKPLYQLLGTLVAAGITTPHAAALGHPWVRAFRQWIPTANETFPHDPQATASTRPR